MSSFKSVSLVSVYRFFPKRLSSFLPATAIRLDVCVYVLAKKGCLEKKAFCCHSLCTFHRREKLYCSLFISFSRFSFVSSLSTPSSYSFFGRTFNLFWKQKIAMKEKKKNKRQNKQPCTRSTITSSMNRLSGKSTPSLFSCTFSLSLFSPWFIFTASLSLFELLLNPPESTSGRNLWRWNDRIRSKEEGNHFKGSVENRKSSQNRRKSLKKQESGRVRKGYKSVLRIFSWDITSIQQNHRQRMLYNERDCMTRLDLEIQLQDLFQCLTQFIISLLSHSASFIVSNMTQSPPFFSPYYPWDFNLQETE